MQKNATQKKKLQFGYKTIVFAVCWCYYIVKKKTVKI